MDYTIIVNDNGELKTISATELRQGGFDFTDRTIVAAAETILDERVRLEALGAEGGYRGTADQRVADDTEHANRGQR